MARVDGRLAVARAFGDKKLKEHLSVDPDVREELICDEDELLILASDGVWKVCATIFSSLDALLIYLFLF